MNGMDAGAAASIRADALNCPAPTRAHFLAVTLLGRDVGPLLTEKMETALDRLAIDRSPDSALKFEGIPIGVVVAVLARTSSLRLKERDHSETVILAARTQLKSRYKSIRTAHHAFITMLEGSRFPKDRQVTERAVRRALALHVYRRRLSGDLTSG